MTEVNAAAKAVSLNIANSFKVVLANAGITYNPANSVDTIAKAIQEVIDQENASALAQLRQAREALAKFVDACESAPPLQLLSELNEACLFAKSALTTTAPKEKKTK